ncbi:MAG: SDR family oxidoreductase [Pseudomonadota bacterium]
MATAKKKQNSKSLRESIYEQIRDAITFGETVSRTASYRKPNNRQIKSQQKSSKRSGGCSFQETNVASKNDILNMVSKTIEAYETIDILINCAGGSAGVPKVSVEDTIEEDWDKVVNLNFKGTFLCTQAVVPYMKKQGNGKIVNLSSVSARINSELTPVQYTSSKGAISTFTRHIAGKLGPYGINVNAVAPGITLTPRVTGMWNERRTEEERKLYMEKIPLRRLGTVQDVVNSVLFLCSSESDYITGITLDVNGGLFSV